MSERKDPDEMPIGAPIHEGWEHQVALRPLSLLGDAGVGACADGVCEL